MKSTEPKTAPSRKANYFFTLLGFGICRAWIVICLASSTINAAIENANWLYLAMGAIAAALVALAADKGLAERLRCHLAEPTLILAIISALIIPIAFVIGSIPLTFAGFMAGGVSAGLLQILWGERFAAFSTRGTVFCSAAAAIITALLTAAFPAAMIVGYTVFPVLSFALLIVDCKISGVSWRNGQSEPAASTQLGDENPNPDTLSASQEIFECENGSIVQDENESTTEDAQKDADYAKSRKRTLVKLMATVAIFSLLTRMFDMMPTYGSDPLGPLGGSPLFSLVIAGGLFLAMTFIPGVKFNSSFIYRISVPIMALGFVVTVALFGKNSSVSLLLIGVGYELFDILAWVLFADIARRGTHRVAFVYGFGVASMFAGMAAGILIGSVIRTSIHGDATQTATLALACILALVVVGFLLLPESLITQLTTRKQSKGQRTSENDSSKQDSTPQEPKIEEGCAIVASEYGLTPRESEVLVFLAKGRTIPIVARDLQIAKGTARTHAERIYRKLDVHKQQELIDLVEKHLQPEK